MRKIDIECKKYYAVVFNIGGFVHEKLYTLTQRIEFNVTWYDRSGNIGFDIDDKLHIGLNQKAGCWMYIHDDMKSAQLFYDGAITSKMFLKHWLN